MENYTQNQSIQTKVGISFWNNPLCACAPYQYLPAYTISTYISRVSQYLSRSL